MVKCRQEANTSQVAIVLTFCAQHISHQNENVVPPHGGARRNSVDANIFPDK